MRAFMCSYNSLFVKHFIVLVINLKHQQACVTQKHKHTYSTSVVDNEKCNQGLHKGPSQLSSS